MPTHHDHLRRVDLRREPDLGLVLLHLRRVGVQVPRQPLLAQVLLLLVVTLFLNFLGEVERVPRLLSHVDDGIQSVLRAFVEGQSVDRAVILGATLLVVGAALVTHAACQVARLGRFFHPRLLGALLHLHRQPCLAGGLLDGVHGGDVPAADRARPVVQLRHHSVLLVLAAVEDGAPADP